MTKFELLHAEARKRSLCVFPSFFPYYLIFSVQFSLSAVTVTQAFALLWLTKVREMMSWIDAIMLPIVMTAWLFLSYDAVNRLCLKRGWPMRDGIGMVLWVTVGFAGGAYIMVLFNVIWPSSCFCLFGTWTETEHYACDEPENWEEWMNVFQNAILTVVWLFTIIMCADLWTDPLINTNTGLFERLGGTSLFISTAVIAHLIIKRILKSTTKEN